MIFSCLFARIVKRLQPKEVSNAAICINELATICLTAFVHIRSAVVRATHFARKTSLPRDELAIASRRDVGDAVLEEFRDRNDPD